MVRRGLWGLALLVQKPLFEVRKYFRKHQRERLLMTIVTWKLINHSCFPAKSSRLLAFNYPVRFSFVKTIDLMANSCSHQKQIRSFTNYVNISSNHCYYQHFLSRKPKLSLKKDISNRQMKRDERVIYIPAAKCRLEMFFFSRNRRRVLNSRGDAISNEIETNPSSAC